MEAYPGSYCIVFSLRRNTALYSACIVAEHEKRIKRKRMFKPAEAYLHERPLQLLVEPRSWAQSGSKCCSLDCNAPRCSGSSTILLLQLCISTHPAHTLLTDASLQSNTRSHSPAQASCTHTTAPQLKLFKQVFRLDLKLQVYSRPPSQTTQQTYGY